MTATMEEIRAQALALPGEARLALSRELYDSVFPDSQEDSPPSDAWKEELDRRIREVDEGRVRLMTKEEFFANIRR